MPSDVERSCRSHFRSVKSAVPVPISSALRLDVLVQSALDPSVDEIGYVHSAVVSGCRVRLDLPVIVRNGSRLAIDIAEDHPLRSVDDEGLSLIALQDLGLEVLELHRADIHREPIAGNARRVWRQADQEVCFDDESAALEALCGKGLAIEQLTGTTGVPVEVVFALACADLVVIDLATQPICAGTMVTISPHHRSRGAELRWKWSPDSEAPL
jgi:hypothetical protein